MFFVKISHRTIVSSSNSNSEELPMVTVQFRALRRTGHPRNHWVYGTRTPVISGSACTSELRSARAVAGSHQHWQVTVGVPGAIWIITKQLFFNISHAWRSYHSLQPDCVEPLILKVNYSGIMDKAWPQKHLATLQVILTLLGLVLEYPKRTPLRNSQLTNKIVCKLTFTNGSLEKLPKFLSSFSVSTLR